MEKKPGGSTVKALFLASHPEPTVAVTLIALALSIASGHGVLACALITVAVLVGQLSVGWHNDWLDAARDHDSGRADKPAGNGSLSIKVVKTGAILAGILTIPASFAAGWLAGGVHIFAVVLAWAYNGWLKFSVFSFLPYALAFPMLLCFVTLGFDLGYLPPWWALLAAGLLGTGAHLANVVPDLEDDERSDIKGLPHRLGRRACIWVAATLLGAATALLTIATPHSGTISWICLGIVVVLLLIGFRFGVKPRSRILFRLSLVIALIDVVLLVIQGHSFRT